MSSTPTSSVPAREQWSGQFGFLMAAIGSAIGLGNIWRFPGVAYSNGGGAFMIPYVVALLAAGVPVLLLDYALGHRYRGSSPAVFRRLSTKFEWLGWWHVVICFVIMTYYAVIVAWALRYTIFSLTTAWGDDASGFFSDYIGLGEVSEAGTPAYSAEPIAGVIIPLVLVWAFGLYVIARGVSKGVERANRVFLPILVVMFLMLVVRAMLLPGATDGLNTLFTPDWSKLGDYRVWMAAFGQIFFSLSIGFGIMLTYASYLKRRSNLVGTGLTAAFANSSFELLAGIGVFATLGFMAHLQNVTVQHHSHLRLRPAQRRPVLRALRDLFGTVRPRCRRCVHQQHRCRGLGDHHVPRTGPGPAPFQGPPAPSQRGLRDPRGGDMVAGDDRGRRPPAPRLHVRSDRMVLRT